MEKEQSANLVFYSAAVNLGVGGFSHDEIVATVKTVPKSQR